MSNKEYLVDDVSISKDYEEDTQIALGIFDGTVTKFKVPPNTDEIRPYFFQYCNNIKFENDTLVIPTHIKKIGIMAFDMQNPTLKKLVLHDDVVIGQYCFYASDGYTKGGTLEEVVMPYIPKNTGYEPFINQDNIKRFNSSVDGEVIFPEGTEEIPNAFFGGLGNGNINKVILPDSLKVINESALREFNNLMEIEIPAGLQKFGGETNAVFWDNHVYNLGHAVHKIYFKGTMEQWCNMDRGRLFTITYGDSTFELYINNEKVNKIVVPDGMITLEGQFRYHGVAEIELPNTITKMEHPFGEWIFGASTFERVIFRGTVAQWNAIEKPDNWYNRSTITEVICTDGTISIGG